MEGVWEVKEQEHVIKFRDAEFPVVFTQEAFDKMDEAEKMEKGIARTKAVVEALVPTFPKDVGLDIVLQVGKHLTNIVQGQFGDGKRPLVPMRGQEGDGI